MRIWLVQTGEEMPGDGEDTRLLRTCLLARELAGRGHEVVYWNSTFSHQKKIQRFSRTTGVAQRGGYRAIFLYGRSYKKNIGFRRILSHLDNAREFGIWTKNEPLPDLVYCGFPPIELARKAALFAKSAGVPAVVDCRDVWPEIIAERIPRGFRLLAAPILIAWERAKRSTMRAATAITGVSEGFVDWGVAAAGRQRGKLDVAFHLATAPEPVSQDALKTAREYWQSRLGVLPAQSLIIAYAGTFSRRGDLMTVLDGADLLTPEERARVRIVLCGSGDLAPIIQRRANENAAIVNGGWRSRPELVALMERSSAGLLPYSNTADFLITYPNKVGEYLTAGLPILTGVEGAISRLLAPRGLRIGYQVGQPASFATALRTSLGRTDLPLLRSDARDLGKSHFDPERIYPLFADWIEELAGAGKSKNDRRVR